VTGLTQPAMRGVVYSCFYDAEEQGTSGVCTNPVSADSLP
jgi:hypothetical protein